MRKRRCFPIVSRPVQGQWRQPANSGRQFDLYTRKGRQVARILLVLPSQLLWDLAEFVQDTVRRQAPSKVMGHVASESAVLPSEVECCPLVHSAITVDGNNDVAVVKEPAQRC